MKRAMIVIPGAFALACGKGWDEPAPPAEPATEAPAAVQAAATPSPPAATAEGGGAGAPAGAGKPLPDVTAGLDKGGCDDGPGNEGARAYFVGHLDVNGDKVTGSEDWLLYANSKLKAAPIWKTDGGSDECVVRWRVEGVTTQPLACGSCDLAVEIRANVDVTASTCPEPLWKREKQWQETYDVRRLSDGTSLWYFHKSGKQFGQGYHSGDSLNYVSDPTCQWF